MGVLEFFGTLIKNDITSTSIKSNFSQKLPINHLFLDFNSIIHVSGQKVASDANSFMSGVLRTLYQGRTIMNEPLTEKFESYGMQEVQIAIDKIARESEMRSDTLAVEVIRLFHEFFNDDRLDKLVITMVINSVLSIIKTFCLNSTIQTIMLAIDGVPSKGKMVEQKQRRYLGAITEKYKGKLLKQFTPYLEGLEDYAYLATKDELKWNRGKITPGTGFMHKMVAYLRSEKIKEKFLVNRPNMEIILSDMYEVGEGEKKIVNYINKYFAHTEDKVMIYSPDADVILLCMLLPVENLYMLRYNQQTSLDANAHIYDLIDILALKNNIAFYINNHPGFPKETFSVDRINYDIVCTSTLFGDDFVPKIETISVKKGFQSIMDAYLKTLLTLQSQSPSGKTCYLVKKIDGIYELSFVFLKELFQNLLPDEDDFIENNDLYAKYISIGQIKNIFDHVEITSENLTGVVGEFRSKYENLKNQIRQNRETNIYSADDLFMGPLKKSLNVQMDGQAVNTSYLSNPAIIKLLKDYFRRYRDFPRVNINLNTWSHSSDDPRHKRKIKEKKMNKYKIEVYKFENMLDEYYSKFNAQPLNLTESKIDSFYEKYFGIRLRTGKAMSEEAMAVMHDYIEGLMWVFEYYYNDRSYINRWYYSHERAPLIRHLLEYLKGITLEDFKDIDEGIKKYHVKKFTSYFTPVEQLIYVSPMTEEVIKLLPSNYQKYIKSPDLDPFLKTYFVNIDEITLRMWNEKVSKDVDCHSIPYFNKCQVSSIGKPTAEDDTLFMKAIRRVKPSEISERRSQSSEPDY